MATLPKSSPRYSVWRTTVTVFVCVVFLSFYNGYQSVHLFCDKSLTLTEKLDLPMIQSSLSQSIPRGVASSLSKMEDSTSIMTISFGNATNTKQAERLVRSLQTNGMWGGPILILTDNPEHYKTQFSSQTNSRNSQVHILTAKFNDFLWHKTFKKEAMRFKRFKTLLLDYLDEHQQELSTVSSSIEHVLYLDVDIVVARPTTSIK